MPHGPRFTHRTHAIFRRCTAPSSMASDPENRSLLGYYGRTATALPLIARRAWDDRSITNNSDRNSTAAAETSKTIPLDIKASMQGTLTHTNDN